jgi:diguanylate cyclase (GGDEF)-like protein/PAS domain S-box-containing protein
MPAGRSHPRPPEPMIDSAAILGGSILIVDDQPANVQLLETMLQRAGYLRVTSTMDPTAVRALHLANSYDLILLDLQMPVMDGFQVMEALKNIETDNYLPVLVITAQPGHKLRALRAGAKDFISKPFDSAEVLTRIHNMLEVRLLHDECKNHNRLLEERVLERTAELRRSEEMFRALAANIPEALWIRDTEQQTIQYVNPAWQKLSGLTAIPGDSLGMVHQTIHPDDLQWVTHERRKDPDEQAGNEYRLVRPDQSVRWVHARNFPIANPTGKVPWIVEIIEDVTQRREAQRQLVHLANHDTLTDLPNRTLLYEALREALMRADAHHLVASVLLLDIDDFKAVNDTLGHTTGDALLREFSARLAKCVRPGDTVGRLGGDEFAVIMLTPEGSRGAIEVAERIRSSMQSPLLLEGQSVLVTTSIGIASYPTDTSNLETLIRYADVAMYDAKASGRNAFRSYTAEMNPHTMEKSDLAGALRCAQGRDEFTLHYQPKMQIDSGKWTSVEALIRWNRPGHGMVLPGLFIPALEEMGLIVPVGAWVIDAACRQILDWEQAGLGQVRIAVNVSSRQVREEQFVPQVADMVHNHRIDPTLLEFEITESTLMAHGEATDISLRKLKDLGISISVDDFGTGYSNLAYLKRFLVDALKIDIAFIRDVTTNPDDATIAVAIINMAHSLRLKVIAEGVETREQLEFLRVHGCDEVQGYLLSKPLPADELSAKLRQSVAHDAGRWLGLRNSRRSEAHA